ncbi:MAG: ABC transporter substrate-binding protein [Spirochaetaceae bacterium]|jgi:peptide/nickel transport system substrate-binding protein|nr:ABC transporter substrate-binding protein [Spirochaetaceae bacterium]
MEKYLFNVRFALVLGIAAMAAAFSCAKPAEKAVQELVIGEQFDLQSIDPKDGMLDDTQILVYNGLVEIDSDFKLTPALAESWEMSADGRLWTFKLRKNVRFHDGESWDAAAAIANFRRLEGYPGVSDTLKIEAADDYTLVFTMKSPVYTLASNFARTMMSMASPKAIREDGSLAYEAGSGPYSLSSWQKNEEFVFDAFDDYWGGKPSLRKITFKVLPDAASRVLALESGDIDMTSGYQTLAIIKKLQDDPRFHLIKKTQNTSEFMLINLTRSPLDDLNVRAAIACALDFDKIVSSLLPGLATPPQGFFSPAYGDLVNPEVKNYPYNLERALGLLGGREISLTLTYNAANTEDALLAPAIQDMLAEAGIIITLEAVDGGALDDALESRDYDLLLAGQSFIPTDDTLFHYRQGYWHSKSYYNIFSSPYLDSMIDELAGTMDADKRKTLNWAIQKEIASQIPFVMVFHRNSLRIAKAEVGGFDISAGVWHINRALKDVVIDAKARRPKK